MSAGLDITAIRAALQSRATSADGVRVALGYMPNKISPSQLPLVCVGNPDPITYNRNFGQGKATLTFRITCIVSTALEPDKATLALDNFLHSAITSASPTSLAALLRLERSTDTEPWLFNVRSAEGYGLYRFDTTDFYGVQLVVDVTT